MSSFSRRSFLKSLGISGCSVAANPLVTPMTFASVPTVGEKRLVVIILRGAMDGLDVLRPVGDPLLGHFRPSLMDATQGNHLTDFYTLHPALASLYPLWQADDLAFVQAVSTPYRDKRSHFDGQDLLEAGTGPEVKGPLARQGWVNRLLQVMPGATAETAFAVGRGDFRLMFGPAQYSSWSPEGRIDLSPQARLLLDEIYHDDPLFRDSGQAAFEIAENLGVLGNSSGEMGSGTSGPARAHPKQLASFAAKRLNDQARIAAFSIGGWDTHRNQARTMPRALSQLSDAILQLQAELGNNWQNTAVLAMTEFGRTVRENGTAGTDHGTGGAMLMAGGAIRGGRVFGDWPGLDEASLYDRRDLMPTADIREYSAALISSFFGIGTTALQNTVFPGLSITEKPIILK